MKLSDDVLARIVQIFQEAMLTGTDCSDLMRQIQVEVDPVDSTQLAFTPAYVELVKRQHDQLLQRAEELKNERDNQKLIKGN